MEKPVPHELDYCLKPCPFCGSPAHLWKTSLKGWAVTCVQAYDLDSPSRCQAAMGDNQMAYESEKEAIQAWNKRATALVRGLEE